MIQLTTTTTTIIIITITTTTITSINTSKSLSVTLDMNSDSSVTDDEVLDRWYGDLNNTDAPTTPATVYVPSVVHWC